MKPSLKLLVKLITLLKIAVLLTLTINSLPLVITHFVLIPLLLLEAIGVAGYLLEFGETEICQHKRSGKPLSLSYRENADIHFEESSENSPSKRIA